MKTFCITTMCAALLLGTACAARADLPPAGPENTGNLHQAGSNKSAAALPGKPDQTASHPALPVPPPSTASHVQPPLKNMHNRSSSLTIIGGPAGSTRNTAAGIGGVAISAKSTAAIKGTGMNRTH